MNWDDPTVTEVLDGPCGLSDLRPVEERIDEALRMAADATDEAEKDEWVLIAADLGHPAAMTYAGCVAFRQGDPLAAARWLRLAHLAGSWEAGVLCRLMDAPPPARSSASDAVEEVASIVRFPRLNADVAQSAVNNLLSVVDGGDIAERNVAEVELQQLAMRIVETFPAPPRQEADKRVARYLDKKLRRSKLVRYRSYWRTGAILLSAISAVLILLGQPVAFAVVFIRVLVSIPFGVPGMPGDLAKEVGLKQQDWLGCVGGHLCDGLILCAIASRLQWDGRFGYGLVTLLAVLAMFGGTITRVSAAQMGTWIPRSLWERLIRNGTMLIGLALWATVGDLPGLGMPGLVVAAIGAGGYGFNEMRRARSQVVDLLRRAQSRTEAPAAWMRAAAGMNVAYQTMKDDPLFESANRPAPTDSTPEEPAAG